MPNTGKTDEKNLIGKKLKFLRKQNRLSQQKLAVKLQLAGMDIGKNTITRIETNQRSVTDMELKAPVEVFQVTYEYFLDGLLEK